MKIKVDTMKQLICLSFLTLCSCSLESDSCQANGNSNEPCKDNLTKDGVKIYGNLNGLHQDDPELIKALKDYVLIPPSKKQINLRDPPSFKNLNGQFSQPKSVEDILQKRWSKSKWKRKIGTGFFVEAGASEGEHISNTLYFEMKRKWTGLLVEPNPDFHKDLFSKNRHAWILPHCLSTSHRVEVVSFDASMYNGGIIKEGKTLPSDIGRKTPREKPLSYRRTIQAQCFPLYSVLLAIGNLSVDYMSLDVEGSELQILSTLPWDKVDFEVIGIETAHVGDVFEGSREDLVNLMAKNGYILDSKAGHDEFFVKENIRKKA